jgi:hypothetical protein
VQLQYNSVRIDLHRDWSTAMGSWVGLDANYPPGTLTPATAFVVALGHLAGAKSVYVDDTATRLAAFLPWHGLDYDHDLLTRTERYLGQVAVEQFLDEARRLLNPEQKLCLALNLLDAVLAQGVIRPGDHPHLAQILEGLGATAEQLQPYWHALAIKNDLGLFPQ